MLSRSNRLGELLHVVEDISDLVYTSFIDSLERLGHASVSQSNVEYRSVFRGIDVRSAEHLIASLLNLGFTSQAEQCTEHLFVDQVLGIVEEDGDIRTGGGSVGSLEFVKARRIRSKEVLEYELGALALVELLEFPPGRVVFAMKSAQVALKVSALTCCGCHTCAAVLCLYVFCCMCATVCVG